MAPYRSMMVSGPEVSAALGADDEALSDAAALASPATSGPR
jgi:hypothetical protein